MNFFLYIISFLTGMNALYSQGIRGQVTDQQGNFLSFATIYVLKIQKGTASNEEGYYELSLPPGNYEVRFQYLGYTTRIVNVQVGSAWQNLPITLNEEPVDLEMIEILDNREDPAYTIMRRAIGKAGYHAQQLDAYSAISYIKGSGRLKDVPGLFRKRIEKALEEEGIDTSTAFVTESVSEISYQRPNQFKEKVISVRTIGEDNNTSPNQFINSSFYLPEVTGAISPLSPRAFAYYRFEYLGFFSDHGFNVNKIKVTPRSRGDKVFEGTLYIVDNIWSIHSLDLTTSIWGIRFNINQIYEPVLENVWLPLNHIYNITGSFFGFDFEYQYFANISDYQISLNPDLPPDIVVIDDKIEKTRAAEVDQQINHKDSHSSTMEALTSGQEVSQKQLRKMLRDYEKEEMKQEMAGFNDTTAVDIIQVSEFSVDSNAYKRDSSYWEVIRPIPLTDYEVKGYSRMDSLSRVEVEKDREQDTLSMTIASDGMSISRKKGGDFAIQDILFGGNYKAGKKVRFGWDSPLTRLHFNTVEGYHMAMPFFVQNVSNAFRWRLSPTVHYSFARNRLNGSLGSTWSVGNKKNAGTLKVDGGRMTEAYNPDAISPFLSDLASLFWERNFFKVYEQTFAQAIWIKKLNAKNQVDLQAIIAERRGLRNQTDHSIFDSEKRAYTSNFPINSELGSTQFDTSSISQFRVQWKGEPWLKYRMRNNQRERIEHSSPIFIVAYRTAITGILDNSVSFHHFDLQMQHLWPIGVRGDLSLKANVGTFINPKEMTIIDLHHFPGNRTSLTTQDPVGSFRLLDYYQFSTQANYAAIYGHYQFRKLFITRLPWARQLGLKEAVFVNILETKGVRHYAEIGYGVNYIFRILRLEGVASFQDGKYQDWGIRLGIASNLEGLFNF